jgi:hypothetical protein
MLNISTSQPVSWSTAPSPPAMAPVGPVPSVGAVQSSARDSQADAGRGGQGSPRGSAVPMSRSPGDGKSNPVQAAPLLPRDHAEESTSSPASMVDEARQRTEQQKEEDQKAHEKAEQKLQLQEVLASVWKASAAVVDVVLGRESVEAASAVDAELAGKAASATGLPYLAPVSGDAAASGTQDGIVDPVVLRRDQEPVAYTVQGASSWAPMEAGLLLNQRV